MNTKEMLKEWKEITDKHYASTAHTKPLIDVIQYLVWEFEGRELTDKEKEMCENRVCTGMVTKLVLNSDNINVESSDIKTTIEACRQDNVEWANIDINYEAVKDERL